MNPEIIGSLAGFLTTFSFAFQVIKILRTPCKRLATSSISIMMYFSFMSGVSLWIIYGISISSLSIVLWNVITLALASIVFGITLRYHGPKWVRIA